MYIWYVNVVWICVNYQINVDRQQIFHCCRRQNGCQCCLTIYSSAYFCICCLCGFRTTENNNRNRNKLACVSNLNLLSNRIAINQFPTRKQQIFKKYIYQLASQTSTFKMLFLQVNFFRVSSIPRPVVSNLETKKKNLLHLTCINLDLMFWGWFTKNDILSLKKME